jgi:DNA-binding IclR family transcriptional regulator
MEEYMITSHEKAILELLSELEQGLTRIQIQSHNIKRNLGLPADELNAILKSLESLHFLRTEERRRKKWYITMRGLAIEKGSGCGWP